MSYIYLCLNQDDVIYDVMVTDYEMIHPERIPVEVADYTLIGKKYNKDDGSFSEVVTVEKKIISRLNFRERFTLAELSTIYTAMETDIVLKIFLDNISDSMEIDLNYPSTQEGMGYLYQQGYITYERMLEILE